MATIDSNNKSINFTEYTPAVFVNMMAWLSQHMQDCSPLVYQLGGYTYFFATEALKVGFASLAGDDFDQAKSKYPYSFCIKDGDSKTMAVNVSSGYNNTVMLGSTGNEIAFTFKTMAGGVEADHEDVTVNYTFECNGVTQVYQTSYNYGETATLNIDDYLQEGDNTITIRVTGMLTNTTYTTSVKYVVSTLSVVSDFDISNSYTASQQVQISVTATGTPDSNGIIKVKFYLDGKDMSNDCDIDSNYYNRPKPHTLTLPADGGLHFLQMQAIATIGKAERKTNTWYYEFYTEGVNGRFVCIKRQLSDTGILTSRDSLVLQCEQYKTENIEFAYVSSYNTESVTVKWTLSGSDSQNVGNFDISDSATQSGSKTSTISFMPLTSGPFQLLATINVVDINGNVTATGQQIYNVNVIGNTSNLTETTTAMTLRLMAMGRYNSEDETARKVWTYKTVTTAFSGFSDWNSLHGWNDGALVLSGGAKAVINLKPLAALTDTSASATVEVEFETFSVKDEDAVLFSVGERIKIMGTSATISSQDGTSKTDHFPTGTKLKLAFVVHAQSSASTTDPLLFEIINNGVTSRLANYQSGDSFWNNGNIVIGGTDKAGIRVYTIRCYTTDLSPKQELNNTIVDSGTSTATLVEQNNIYKNNTEVDVDALKNKIACLWVTGKGDGNCIDDIWAARKGKVEISCDAEWTNPNYPASNWVATNMRLRTHGQSTIDKPMKSLKFWLKNDAGTTTLTVDGTEDTSTDHRWKMKKDSMPSNKYVMQCYYIDSSNCKSPALLSLINDVMTKSGMLTPPQKFTTGTDSDSYYGKVGSAFPYTLRQTPDSMPAILVSRKTSTDAWKFEGIFILMDDKKNDFLYGLRRIYNYAGDPFSWSHDKEKTARIWDNSQVTRFELLSNDMPYCKMTAYENFYGSRQTYETEEATESDADDDTQTSEIVPQYDFEQAIELIYPDYDDYVTRNSNNQIIAFNDSGYRKQCDKMYNFLKWTTECYNITDSDGSKGGANARAKFYEDAEAHLDLQFWAAYYIIMVTNGCFDSPVRNMQMITFETATDSNGKTVDKWLPLWWDIDVQDGTTNNGDLKWMPPVDRETYSGNDYAFRGHDNWVWNALEKWSTFQTLLHDTMDLMYTNGYRVDTLLSLQNDYVDAYPKALYNESENTKYRNMFLTYGSSYSDYLQYCLGDGTTFRKWWIKKNWDYWMARFAAGSFSNNGFSFRGDATPGTLTLTVAYGEDTYFGWAIGSGDTHSMQYADNTTKAYSKELQTGVDHSVSVRTVTNSEYVTIYSATSLSKIDASNFGLYLKEIALDACVGDTGTMLATLLLGMPTVTANGSRNSGIVTLTGLNQLSALETLQMQGFNDNRSIDLSASILLSKVYMKGSAFQSIIFAESITLDEAELPSTLTQFTLSSVKVSSLKFYDPTTLEETIYPTACTRMYLYKMGTDQTIIKPMVLAWLNAYTGNYSDLILKLTQIVWTGCTYDEIVLLGQVAKNSETTLVGEVTINAELTDEQMDVLSGLYNDDAKGINVFGTTSNFKINSAAGFTVQGATTLNAGETTTLKGTVFPIGTTGYTYTFELTKVDGKAVACGDPITSQSWHNFTVYNRTGIIETVEDTNETAVYTILCKAVNETDVTAKSFEKELDITVNKRVYPTAATINGQSEINSSGDYGYAIGFTYDGDVLNGTMTSKQWTLSGGDANIYLKNQGDKSVTLYIGNIDDYVLTIGYTSSWKGITSAITASKTVIVMSDPTHVVLTADSNPYVYAVLSAWYKANISSTVHTAGALVRRECKQFTTLPSMSQYADQITDFPEVKEFTGLTTLDLSDLPNLSSAVLDLTALTQCKSINLSGTVANCKCGKAGKTSALTYLHLGTPTSITITNCSNLNISE